jgi:hypothetical protein
MHPFARDHRSPHTSSLPRFIVLLVLGLHLVVAGVAGCDDEALRAGPFACGEDGLTCEGSSEACAGRGNGTCTGDAPGPDGCDANCHQFDCGGMVRCLCSSFECVDLGDCTDCECAKKLPGRSSCMCDDSNGTLVLECPGA